LEFLSRKNSYRLGEVGLLTTFTTNQVHPLQPLPAFNFRLVRLKATAILALL
jgi:hypothetical protein